MSSGDTATQQNSQDDHSEARPPWRPVPRVVIKADLLPAVSVLSSVALLGLPIGWLWAQLAPAQRLRMSSSGALESLPLESYHEFDGVAVFLLLTMAAGAVAGFAVWLLRSRRGPVILFAAVLGSLISAWLAMRTGMAVAEGMYPSVPVSAGDLVVEPPRITVGWVVLGQPLMLSLVYGFAAGFNVRDDLGRRLG